MSHVRGRCEKNKTTSVQTRSIISLLLELHCLFLLTDTDGQNCEKYHKKYWRKIRTKPGEICFELYTASQFVYCKKKISPHLWEVCKHPQDVIAVTRRYCTLSAATRCDKKFPPRFLSTTYLMISVEKLFLDEANARCWRFEVFSQQTLRLWLRLEQGGIHTGREK